MFQLPVKHLIIQERDNIKSLVNMNLKHVLTGVALCTTGLLFAQNQEDVLLTIEGNNITVSEFMAIYNKNNVEIQSADKKSVGEYLDLYLNFKLKVHDAEVQGYDTNSSFQNELNGYVDQLAAPYLVDNQFTEGLIKEAYDRSKEEVRASHIMIKISENPTPDDTLKAWNKAWDVYKKANLGVGFTELAEKYSEDPSVEQNKGDLGYFSAFRMVYPFETAAYSTPVGSVATPIRTTYGYHIIKVTDKRPARGEIKAAHIMIISNEKSSPDEAKKAKKKIAEIYEELKAGAAFSKLANTYSDDRGSAQKGGDLGWFGAGKMVPDFEEHAFALAENGDFSEPFLTQFGWHIILREDKRNMGTYEEEYEELSKKVKHDRRSLGSQHSLVTKLKVAYGVKIKEKSKLDFYKVVDSSYFANSWSTDKAAGLDAAMITINDKTYGKKKVVYTQKDFAEYLVLNMRGNSKKKAIPMLVNQEFNSFVDDKIIEYEKSILSLKHNEYKALLTEYHDGILLFEIMEQEVWKKAMRDTTGLDSFFLANEAKYMWEERLNTVLYICKTEQVANEVQALLLSNTADSIILTRMNKDSELPVTIRSGKFEKGKETLLQGVEWKKGISTHPTDHSFVVVKVISVLPSEPKKINEVKGLVTSAYQDELDKQWVEKLRTIYSYKIHQEVLDEITK
tara:strand:+ start:176507 stop:178540 length:2034 start_codon:yes stop_codon:yes gene_type:complete